MILSELDVQAPSDTLVVVAYGDSITDGTFSTVNGTDRWPNVMSRELHDVLGDKVSVAVVGATVTSSYPPGGAVPANSPLAASAGAALAASCRSAQTDASRQQLNAFILGKGHYDAVADLAAATTDPSAGSLYQTFVPNSEGSAGDYLHPHRAGYQVMGAVTSQAVLSLGARLRDKI